jgi:hypothetical protein
MSQTTTIKATQDYHLHIKVVRVGSSETNLSISSSWAGAKDPNERRPLFDVTLENSKFKELSGAIQKAIND